MNTDNTFENDPENWTIPEIKSKILIAEIANTPESKIQVILLKDKLKELQNKEIKEKLAANKNALQILNKIKFE